MKLSSSYIRFKELLFFYRAKLAIGALYLINVLFAVLCYHIIETANTSSTFTIGVLVLSTLLQLVYLFYIRTQKNYSTKDLVNRIDENQRILEGLHEVCIVAITDPQGVITYVNDAFTEISGYTQEELIGKTHRVVRSNFHPNKFYHDMWKTIKEGRVWQGLIKNRAKNGSFYWVNTSIIPFMDNQGEILHYLSIRQDISLDKEKGIKTEESLIKKLTEKNFELEEFAHTISHELRKPITYIKGLIPLITSLDSSKLSNESLGYLDYMDETSTELLRLIDGLLEFSLTGSKKDFKRLNLNKIIEKSLNKIYNLSLGIIINTNIDKNLYIYGIRNDLITVIDKILDNSIKYAKQNQPIIIDIKTEYKVDIVRIDIQDNGVGIDDRLKKHVFNIFEKSNSTDGHKSYGIGLTQCKKIIQYHNGSISLKSTIDKGTIITLEIPVFVKESRDKVSE